MQVAEAIVSAALDRVSQMHGEILSEAMSILRKPVSVTEEYWGCSYRKHLGTYISEKLAMHRIQKKIDSGVLSYVRTEDYNPRLLNDLLAAHRLRMSYAKIDMMQAPCKFCHTCRMRSKPWPSGLFGELGDDLTALHGEEYVENGIMTIFSLRGDEDD